MRLRDVEGRSHRIGFVSYYVLVFLVSALITLGLFSFAPPELAFVLSILTSAVSAMIVVAAAIRRAHDIGWSGWWVLLLFIPIANLVLFVLLLLWPGQPGDNEFGASPSNRTTDHGDVGIGAPQQEMPGSQQLSASPKRSALIWPNQIRQQANVAIRLGRAIHWLSAGIAAILLFFAAWNLLSYAYYWEDIAPACLMAVALFFGGRATRYVIAGE